MTDKIRSLKIHSQDVTEGFRRAPRGPCSVRSG